MTRAVYHSILRTSPKGGPFIGVCTLCGQEGLRSSDATKECTNPKNLTENEALLEALKTPERRS